MYSEYVLLVVRIAIPSVLYYWYAIRSTTGHGMFNTTGTNVCRALILYRVGVLHDVMFQILLQTYNYSSTRYGYWLVLETGTESCEADSEI